MPAPVIAVIGPGGPSVDASLERAAQMVGASLAVVVRSAAAVIAVGGGYRTLSEIGFALTLGRPVVGIATWVLHHPEGMPDRILRTDDPAAAVRLALQAIRPD